MAHTLEALKNSVIQGVVTVPDDGDAQAVAGVNGPFLALENARAALYPLALGLSSGVGWIRADPGGSNVSPKVFIGQVCGVLLEGEVCEVGGTREIVLADVDGSPANLANNTWYYVVLRKPAAALTPGVVLRTAVVGVTTSPPSSLLFGDDIAERYVGCFVTDSSGAPRPMYSRHGVCTYRTPVSCSLGGGGTATVATDVDVSAAMPPHARAVNAELGISSGGSAYYAEFYSGSALAVTLGQSSEFVHRRAASLCREGGTSFRYLVSNAGATAGFSVMAFTE